MNISRKVFLRLATMAAAGSIIPGKAFSNFLKDEDGFKEIRNGIGIFTDQGGTIGWYISKEVAVGIDSEFPDSAKKFVEGLQKRNVKKLDLHFNTRHHGDHTLGNFVIKDFTSKIIAQENCPVLQKKAYAEGENGKLQVYADTTFKDEWETEIGKEKIHAIYFGPAHTGGDAIYHFQNSNIAHVGDLVFNKVFPFIDSNGGGSIKGWIKVLESSIKHFDNDTTFIFGHAPDSNLVVGTKESLIDMKDYFSLLMVFVSKQIKNGKTKDEIINAERFPGSDRRKERREGAKKMNLIAAYDELSI